MTYHLPRVSIKLSAFVDSKNQIDLLARTERLIQYPLVMFLSGPFPAQNTDIQIVLLAKSQISGLYILVDSLPG